MFTPLKTKLGDVLMEIKDDPALRWPARLRAPSYAWNKKHYYRFHRDHGHDTEDCIDLKQQIEGLIKQGRLSRHVANQGRDDRRSSTRAQTSSQPIGEIRVISGGFAGGGELSSARKKHARDLRRGMDVMLAEGPSKKTKTDRDITFTEKEAMEIH